MGASLSSICSIDCCRLGAGRDDDECSEAREYQPLLGDRERHAVADLVKLFETDTRVNFYEGGPLKALTVLAHSDVHHLQLSAATAFGEISEYDVRAVTAEAVEPMLYLLQSPYADVQRGASAALGNLARVVENKRLIVKMGGLQQLIRQMLSSSTEAQINSVGCITNLAADEENKLAIAKSGALVPLTRLARSKDQRVQRNATGALLNMTHRAELRHMLIEAGSVSVLVDLIASADEETQYYAMTALSNIAVDSSGRDVLWESHSGLVDVLVKALHRPHKIKLQSQIVLTLRNLACDTRYQIQIVERGGLEAMLPLLQSSYTLLITSTTACLRNISIEAGNEEAIINAGFLAELVDLIPQADEPELQCHAISTVRNMAANSGTDKQVFVELGLFDRVKAALSDSRTQPKVVCELVAALSVFALNDKLWRPIVELGLCRLLVQVATRSRNVEAEYSASLALGTLAGKGLSEVFDEYARLWRGVPNGGGLRAHLAKVVTLSEYANTNVRSVGMWLILVLLNSGREDLKERIVGDAQLVAAIEELAKTSNDDVAVPPVDGDGESDRTYIVGAAATEVEPFAMGGLEGGRGNGTGREMQRTQALALQAMSHISVNIR
ncbi:Vacuolar protein 8 [Coemansia thaxteri]|uniref:Vacuolar protein 8 n=1 Tax=Coemansia thaxteri TaxID=2663907 RepID=A0A9W8B9W1_9FUNG|nr:Vacuolar protein 8 [Coemansia thaxteri]KAJ2477062.1 Vacuolar protein 8 [Coemansia sp. RSA 2320]